MREPDPAPRLPEPGQRDLTVEVTRLDTRGGSARRATVAAVLVVGALGAAILSGAFFPPAPAIVAPAPSGRVAPTPGVAASPGEPTLPAPSALNAALPDLPYIDVPSLVAGVKDGTLDGRLVLVDGDLVVTRMPCPVAGAAPGCQVVALSVADVPVSVQPAAELVPWDRDPAPGGTLVMVARHGSLEYLGSIVRDVTHAVSISTLLENPNRRLSLPDLYLVGGWYLPQGWAYCVGVAAVTPGPSGSLIDADGCLAGPYLVDVGRNPYDWTGGADGARVTEAAAIVGVPPPAGGIWVPGTFLVRRIYRPPCDAPAADPSAADPSACAGQFVIRPQVAALVRDLDALRVSVVPRSGGITGQVVDALGRPMAHLAVQLTDDGGARYDRSSLSTDADGRFAVSGLGAPDGGWVEVLEPMPGGAIVIGRVHVEVYPGETSDVVVVVTPGVALPALTPG